MTVATPKRSTEEMRKLRKQAGVYIRELRLAAGLSQLDLAQRLKLQYYTFISQIENGAARVPPESIDEFAAALGVARGEFAKTLLSFYDPWTYRAIFDA
ncbi:MAG: helix-turn-helix domain-containing protein [Alphaproteobacteria bacterium]